MRFVYYIGVLLCCISCTDAFEQEAVTIEIVNPDLSNKTVLTFKELYGLHNRTIGKDTVVVGYVVSSDVEKNFFKELYVQNTFEVQDISEDNPRMGLKLRLGATALSARFAMGRKVIINLEGLRKTTSNESLVLGTPTNFFIKDVIEFEIENHVLKTNDIQQIAAKKTTISALSKNDVNTLVAFKDVHFTEVGIPLAGLPTDRFDGKRVLEFCTSETRDSILLETSNFSNFSSLLAPNKQVAISGILQVNFDKQRVLSLNSAKDIINIGDYKDCVPLVFPDLLITEVADPDVGTGEKARYVEIYNPTNQSVSLDGWLLKRFNKTATRENEDVIRLENLVILPKKTIVIANNAMYQDKKTWFEFYFGLSPAFISSKIDGNGDDAYQLVDPLNQIKDVYGIPNVDGSDSVWEYEDGVAVRKKTVIKGAAIFNADEWEIKKEVPQLKATMEFVDYSPGIH